MEFACGVTATLDRISALIGAVEVQLIGVGSADIQTQKKREQLYKTAADLLEAARLSQCPRYSISSARSSLSLGPLAILQASSGIHGQGAIPGEKALV
jgi:hypothetical protein